MPSHAATGHHSVYGLTVETWMPFPELLPARPGEPVDAVFRLGDVPAELEGFRQRGARFQSAPGRLLAWLDDVARFLVLGGREIVVQPEPNAIESDLRLFTLNSPMGGLLLQRGLLPLHASAIATPRGAVLFMGPSGAGKSTIAANFQRRGFAALADDVSVVRFAPDGVPWVMPGMPRFKLWPDALERLGSAAEELDRLRPMIEKRELPLRDGFHPEPLPLDRIYILRMEPRRKLELTRLTGTEMLPPLLQNTYRAQFVHGLGLAADHFRLVGRVANAAKVTIASRTHNSDPDLLADRVAADLET